MPECPVLGTEKYSLMSQATAQFGENNSMSIIATNNEDAVKKETQLPLLRTNSVIEIDDEDESEINDKKSDLNLVVRTPSSLILIVDSDDEKENDQKMKSEPISVKPENSNSIKAEKNNSIKAEANSFDNQRWNWAPVNNNAIVSQRVANSQSAYQPILPRSYPYLLLDTGADGGRDTQAFSQLNTKQNPEQRPAKLPKLVSNSHAANPSPVLLADMPSSGVSYGFSRPARTVSGMDKIMIPRIHTRFENISLIV